MFEPNHSAKYPLHILAIRWLKLSFGITIHLFVDLLQCVTSIFKRTKAKNISGQVALVTGGGNGLGREISIQLAKEGCNVVIADIDLKRATETSEMLIEQYNIKSNAYNVDIRNYNEIKLLKTKIENTLGPVDILINNAGLMPTESTLFESTPEDIEKVMQVNLLAQIWTVKIFLSSMKERKKGHIVAICAMAGLSATPISSSYSASKYGVRGFMESLRSDLLLLNLDKDIPTTTIYPYFIATNPKLINYLDENQVLQYIPIMSPSYVGERIMQSILKNKIEVIIPGGFKLHMLLKMILPINTYNYYIRTLSVVKLN